MSRVTQSIHRLLLITNWLVIGGFGVSAFLNPETTGIGFVSFFVAGCVHILINWVFKRR
tara:strand:- start:289 stop:465 length:177 start_codon:yes stop_codon:yes gene_type:complete